MQPMDGDLTVQAEPTGQRPKTGSACALATRAGQGEDGELTREAWR
jgi:hypothetical protein